MPHNYHWRREDNNFFYKPQDYTNSCFAACLQMALVNFGIIRGIEINHPGRPIEDDYNWFCAQFHHINIDINAPNINIVNEYMVERNFQGRRRIDVEIINPMMERDIAYIQNCINDNENIAVIGAVHANGGHATMIIKIAGVLYAVNPWNMLNNYFFSGQNGVLHLDFFEHNGGIGLQCDQIMGCMMTYCYIVILH